MDLIYYYAFNNVDSLHKMHVAMQSLPDLVLIFTFFYCIFFANINNPLVGIVSVLHLEFIAMGAIAQIVLTMSKMKPRDMRQLKPL